MNLQFLGFSEIIILIIIFLVTTLYPIAFFITNVLGISWWSFDFYISFVGIELILFALINKGSD